MSYQRSFDGLGISGLVDYELLKRGSRSGAWTKYGERNLEHG